MSTIESAYINALLADAVYVISPGLDADRQKRDLETRMTPTQAAFIADNFEVLNSIETPKLLGSGFDAVVWKGRAESDYAGQIFVSMRGTQGLEDIADDALLAVKGIPYQQIADMVNWWLANTASAGATEVKQIQVLSIGNFQTFAPSTPTVGTGFLAGLGPITAVNGHSLGGYLATAFTRLFGKDVQSVNTYNSAGFSNVAPGNIEYESRNIANLIGSAAGLTSFE